MSNFYIYIVKFRIFTCFIKLYSATILEIDMKKSMGCHSKN